MKWWIPQIVACVALLGASCKYLKSAALECGANSDCVVPGYACCAYRSQCMTVAACEAQSPADAGHCYSAESGNVVWTAQMGAASILALTGIAVSSDEIIYVAGTAKEPTFDGFQVDGGGDAFLVRIDSSGRRVWTRVFGTSNFDTAAGVAVSSEGYVFVAGLTRGAMPGGEIAGVFPNAYLTKFDADGGILWTRQLASDAGAFASALAISPSGAVFVTGEASGVLGASQSRGGSDGFLAKYDADGGLAWTRLFGSVGNDMPSAIHAQSDDAVFVTGVTYGDWGDGGTQSATDTFVARFDADGGQRWVTQFASVSDFVFNEGAFGVVASGSRVYAAGAFQGRMWSYTSVSNSNDGYWVALDVDSGALVSISGIGAAGWEGAYGVAGGSAVGEFFVVGNTDQSLSKLPPFGETDAFLVKYEDGGVATWTCLYGTNALEYANAVARSPSGAALYVAGTTSGILPGAANPVRDAGLMDLFVLRLKP